MSIEEFGAIPIADVKRLERQYNVQLPIDYIDFLCTHGGGVAPKKPNIC